MAPFKGSGEVGKKKPEKKRKPFQMPHTYVILTIILLIVVVLTYIIPAGSYDRVLDEASGKMVVIPDSYHHVEGKQPGFFDIFLNIQRGYVSAADILFLIVFAYAYVYVLTENGTLNSAIQVLIKKLGNRTHLMLPVCMMIFGLLGATLGIFEETYGLVPAFIGIMMGLGYDALVGGAVVYVGVATGFSAALTNPFSVGIAQSVADVPMNSGLGYRIIVFLAFQTAAILYVMHYAKQVKADPTRSVLYGKKREVEAPPAETEDSTFTIRQKLCLLLFFVTIGLLVYGTMKLEWYIEEISTVFLMMMVITGLISGYSPTKICNSFVAATKSVVPSILVIGFTRGILLTMKESMISDTVVHGLAQLLNSQNKVLSANGMLLLQNVINFFITGSSSQATITMPIMAPVADIVGISRQIAVLCYCFGDGFSDMFWPTACSLECGLMGVSLSEWYKFIAPLFGIMMVLQVLFVSLAVFIY